MRAVAGIGIASVIHKNAIRKTTAPTLCPSGLKFSGVGKERIKINRGIPRIRPTFCLIF